jgi:predicted 3-demethylubiquinone-9 3-methyltransferase (glyoxalase superfamily)
MPSITPSLWFDHNLEEAAAFYISIFPNSHMEDLNRSTDAGPGEPGSLLSGTFVLDGPGWPARIDHQPEANPTRRSPLRF